MEDETWGMGMHGMGERKGSRIGGDSGAAHQDTRPVDKVASSETSEKGRPYIQYIHQTWARTWRCDTPVLIVQARHT